MNQTSQFDRLFRAPQLSRTRVLLALGVAVLADFLQIVLFPAQSVGFQQFIDVAAMVLTTLVLGFHWLLLPTFVLEFIPFLDWAPTWTGCVAAVIALRKRDQTGREPGAPPIVSAPPNQDAKPVDQKLLS